MSCCGALPRCCGSAQLERAVQRGLSTINSDDGLYLSHQPNAIHLRSTSVLYANIWGMVALFNTYKIPMERVQDVSCLLLEIQLKGNALAQSPNASGLPGTKPS